MASRRRRLLWVVVGVAATLAVVTPVGVWALAGTGGPYVAAESPSLLPSDAPVPASPSPPLPKGVCVGSQLRAAKVTSDAGLAQLGMQRQLTVIRIQNSGEACTFKVPKILEVASDTGPYHAVDVGYGGYGADGLFHTAAGRSYIAISEEWAMPSQPPVCSDPITQVTRIDIPLAAGAIQVSLPEPWVSVCVSSGTTVIMEFQPPAGTISSRGNRAQPAELRSS